MLPIQYDVVLFFLGVILSGWITYSEVYFIICVLDQIVTKTAQITQIYIYLCTLFEFMKLTEKHQMIMRELIRDARASDTLVSQKTGIPLKTVNRLRKQLEKENYLSYYTMVGNREEANFRSLVTFTCKNGITRKHFLDWHVSNFKANKPQVKHILASFLAEHDMKLKFIVILESKNQEDMLEIVNAEFIPELRQTFGEDAIESVENVTLSMPLRVLRNYFPKLNYDKGHMRPDWPDENIII